MEKLFDLRMRGLVVDDFATMRKIVRNILKQIGFPDIIEAEDGNAALRLIKSEKGGWLLQTGTCPTYPASIYWGKSVRILKPRISRF